MCESYLFSYYKEPIIEVLKDVDENKHFSVNINFIELSGNDPNLGNRFLIDPEESLEEWNTALYTVQTRLIQNTDEKYIFKKHVHCRIFSLPFYPELHRTKFPLIDDNNQFLQVSGTVFRMTALKMLEYQRQYVCTKCKYLMTVPAEYRLMNIIKPPKKCQNPDACTGTTIVRMGELNAEFCKDYQEVKMQENVSQLDGGSIPKSMWVTLEDDLVDSCKPGDNITVCGLVKYRHEDYVVGKKIELELVLKANHVQVNNANTSVFITPRYRDMFKYFWMTYSNAPLQGRDMILKSICPKLFGLFIVKLATAVVLAGGSNLHNDPDTGVKVRAEPHMLLVGDPGTGKSQVLRFASKIIPRSVLTTGVGSTAAGLTAAAIMENGEWQLEGGALVMSDGGICCIDEFNTMKEHDRTSIHEAMEQQTISVAKAGIVCKLSTRCSLLAATNPKGKLDLSQPLSMNVALPSPLLSRFDLVLLLQDNVDKEWDTLIADYILHSFDNSNTSRFGETINWTIETLQAYFAIIKKIHPVLTQDSNKILSSYYQSQRKKTYRNKARTTVRLLDSLIRLSQGHARLMFHEQVEIVDAVMAIALVETAVESNTSVFTLNFNVKGDFPQDPQKNYEDLAKMILEKLELTDLLQKELDPKVKPPSPDLSIDPSGSRSQQKYSKTDQDPAPGVSGLSRFNTVTISAPEQEKKSIQAFPEDMEVCDQPLTVKTCESSSSSINSPKAIESNIMVINEVPKPVMKSKYTSCMNKFRFAPKVDTSEPLQEKKSAETFFEDVEIGDISFANVVSSTQKSIDTGERKALAQNTEVQTVINMTEKKIPKKFNFKKCAPAQEKQQEETLSSIFEQDDLDSLNLDI